MKEYAIIVAGGKGTRMHSDLSKQFIPLSGIPVIIHTIEKFRSYSGDISIILGLPIDDFPIWENISEKFKLNADIKVVAGGKTRFQTVRNCLQEVTGPGLVAIHDGVRPLVKIDTIKASFNLASVHKSAVASVRLKESLRRTNQDGTEAVDRSQYRVIQTPQTFDIDLIKKAYECDEESWMTDDASVAEHNGHSISLFEGSYDNIKITTPSDMVIAESLINTAF